MVTGDQADDAQLKFLNGRYTIIPRTFKWQRTKMNKRIGIHQHLNKIGGRVLTKTHIHRHSDRRADRPILSTFTIMSRESQAS